jgi:hypothetical protein
MNDNFIIHNVILGVISVLNLLVILTYFYGQGIHLSMVGFYILCLSIIEVIISWLYTRYKIGSFYILHFVFNLFKYSLFVFYLIVEKGDDNIVLTLFIVNSISMSSWILIAYYVSIDLFRKTKVKKSLYYYKIVDNTEDDCSICLESKLSGDIIELECTHTFHKECINKWLTNNESCPYCRQDIV